MMCHKCGKLSGVILLLLGIVLLLGDIYNWSFWGIHWYTAVILLAGIGHIGCSGCKDCQAMCNSKKK